MTSVDERFFSAIFSLAIRLVFVLAILARALTRSILDNTSFSSVVYSSTFFS
jgi:hypothetical protein